jgi:hypothetical protein
LIIVGWQTTLKPRDPELPLLLIDVARSLNRAPSVLLAIAESRGLAISHEGQEVSKDDRWVLMQAVILEPDDEADSGPIQQSTFEKGRKSAQSPMSPAVRVIMKRRRGADSATGRSPVYRGRVQAEFLATK